MKILGIETSCDETAAAVVDENGKILSNVIHSQIKIHEKYGGVVPEVAARSHIDFIDKVVLQALEDAQLKISEIDGVAATAGPGLIGGLIVGLMAGKTLASTLKKPFIAVNHLEAHVLTARLSDKIEFPYLTLLVSGGHCQILLVKGVGNCELIGQTLDDALGEAFDKVAQMIGLPYPGGPQVEKAALMGNSSRFKFPKPLIHNNEAKFDFSFSGLKTAVRREIENLTQMPFSHFDSYKNLSQQDISDICASFQKTVVEILIDRLKNIFEIKELNVDKIVIAGGVAANQIIFGGIKTWAKTIAVEVFAPPIKLCTDNAAMVAWAGVERLKLGLIDNLNFKPRAKWPLENKI
jgi:N6-L-threonylcarbamoyladenine synthase